MGVIDNNSIYGDILPKGMPRYLLDIDGPDGNVFVVMGVVKSILESESDLDSWEEFMEVVDNKPTTYKETLNLAMKYVDIGFVSGNENYEDIRYTA